MNSPSVETIQYQKQAEAYNRLANRFIIEGRNKEANLCRNLGRSIATGNLAPSIIDPAEMPVTVGHMSSIARAMGDIEAFNLTPEQVATRLSQLPLDIQVVTRLNAANIFSVRDVLSRKRDSLVVRTYWFGELKLTHLLFVFAREGLYPQTLEEHRPLGGVLSRLPWRQN